MFLRAKNNVPPLVARIVSYGCNKTQIDAELALLQGVDTRSKTVNHVLVQHAKAGSYKVVNFLLKHYDADPNMAVYGYALGGHEFLVEGMMRSHQPVDKSYFAMGYAEAGKLYLVDFYLNHEGFDANLIIKGLKRGGFDDKAQEVVTRCANVANANLAIH